MAQIHLPNNGWTPRPDQMPLWNYLRAPNYGPIGKRADIVAHRRWGKDDVSLHHTAVEAHRRIGVYWHMLPEASQARKAIWDAVNPRTGKRRIDEAFPKELRASTKDNEMFIRFKNGSTWQVVGSDNYNSLVGSPPLGVVFSEWSLADPSAWAYIRPILLENGGWAVFIWTPRGPNHAVRSFKAREKDPMWFTQRLPASVTGVFTQEQLVLEKAELMREAESIEEGEAKYLSEYEVDFEAPVPGSYYAEHMAHAEKGLIIPTDSSGRPKLDPKGNLVPFMQGPKRIGEFKYDPNTLVETAWDLGIDDYTAIWFFQRYLTHVNFISYYETSGSGFRTIKEEAFDSKVWRWGPHHLPHDVMVREIGAAGKTRKQSLLELGFKDIRVGTPHNAEERVSAVRALLPFCNFDEENCATGIEHLKQYRKKYNRSLKQYTGPLHDEHSHGADAFGEAAYNVRLKNMPLPSAPAVVEDRWQKIFEQARKDAQAAKNWKVV